MNKIVVLYDRYEVLSFVSADITGTIGMDAHDIEEISNTLSVKRNSAIILSQTTSRTFVLSDVTCYHPSRCAS